VRCLPIACAIAIATNAHAEGLGIVAVGDSASDRATIAKAIGDAIGARGRLVPDAIAAARSAVAAGAVPISTLAAFRRVRDMIDEGWRAFLRVQVDFAQNRLAAARTEAEALVALPGGAELYADAALRLGAVLNHRGLKDAAAVFALPLALDPERPVTPAEFSPDVVDAVAAVRMAPVVLQKLHVQTAPPGAAVAIDGKELGRAPLDVQVTRGQHLVVARAPGFRATVQGVAVGEAATVELSLERDDDAVRLAEGARPGLPELADQQLIDATLIYDDLDEVVLAGSTFRRGGPTLLVQRCAGVPAQCTAVVDIGYSERTGLAAAAREAWDAVQRGALRYPPSVVGDVKHAVAPPTGCRWCRNPLVWSGVGAVLLGTAITLIVTSGSHPAPVVNVNGGDWTR